jgi:VWFA-related protein
MTPAWNRFCAVSVSMATLMIRSLVAGLLALGVAAPQDAVQQPLRIDVNYVVAPTVVTDREGNFVNGLQPQQFRLSDNGTPQNIKVDITWVPISMVVAIQANSAAEPALPRIQKIAPLFKPLVLGDQGEVAILCFDHRIQMLQDFTGDTDKLDAALKKLKPGSGSSRMVDAVVEATNMLRHKPADRRRILLLISETRDLGSSGKVREALTGLQFENVNVYSVNMSHLIDSLLAKPQPPRPDSIPFTARPMPAGVPPTPDNAAQVSGNATNSGNVIPLVVEIFKDVKAIFVANPVEVFTKWTGGRERSFLTERDLERAILSIGNELHSEYLITYTPNNKAEGGYHEIVVTVPDHPGVKVRTRPGYWTASKF